jgi:hypothetical protein
MPVPTAYTEATLGEFLVDALGDLAAVLGWTLASMQVQRAVTDTERLLGVADVATAPNAAQVEAFGAVAILRRAVVSLGARYTLSEDQQSYHRSDLLKHAQAALALAEQHAAVYGLGGSTVQVGRLDYLHDPYAVRAEDAVL